MIKRNQLKNYFYILIFSVLLIGILEFTTRLIFEYNTVFNINIGGIKKHHPTRRVELKKNYKAEGISINSYGILGPEFKLQPNPKGIRL